jgi:hypothetical protein
VDTTGNAYVTGKTDSHDLLAANPLQASHGGGVDDIFMAKVGSGPLSVTIDIEPGSSTNSVNPRSNGNIPVAALTTDSLDATSEDPSTVRFGRKGKEAAPLRSSLEDVDRGGDTDLLLHFATQQTVLLCVDSATRLTGKTFDGHPSQARIPSGPWAAIDRLC